MAIDVPTEKVPAIWEAAEVAVSQALSFVSTSEVPAILDEGEIVDMRWEPWRLRVGILVRTDVIGGDAKVCLIILDGVAGFAYESARAAPVAGARMIAKVEAVPDGSRWRIRFTLSFQGSIEVVASDIVLTTGLVPLGPLGFPDYVELTPAQVAVSQPSWQSPITVQENRRWVP